MYIPPKTVFERGRYESLCAVTGPPAEEILQTAAKDLLEHGPPEKKLKSRFFSINFCPDSFSDIRSVICDSVLEICGKSKIYH